MWTLLGGETGEPGPGFVCFNGGSTHCILTPFLDPSSPHGSIVTLEAQVPVESLKQLGLTLREEKKCFLPEEHLEEASRCQNSRAG